MFFFFFKQKTAYEMRISDWSSDVCSSDLAALLFITLPFTVQAYTPEISSLPTVAQLRVDPATIAPAISAIKNQPLLFAVGTAMNVATDAGTWDEPQAGVARWRLRIN